LKGRITFKIKKILTNLLELDIGYKTRRFLMIEFYRENLERG
jgi:hypothetical protein